MVGYAHSRRAQISLEVKRKRLISKNQPFYVKFCYWTDAPKGVSDSLASLKHCLPKGMPMMVMHHKRLANRKLRDRHRPPKMIQMTFAMGCLPKLVFTFVPKGQAETRASLKHCLPKGMPMMVMHHRMPHKNQAMAEPRPVKMSQRRLPINFIRRSFVVRYLHLSKKTKKCQYREFFVEK